VVEAGEVVEVGEAAEAVVAVAVVVEAVVVAVALEAQVVGVGEEVDREAEVKEGWEACAPVRVRAGSVSARPVTPPYRIRQASPALTGSARIVESG